MALAGTVGVVESESCVDLKMADTVALNDGPSPPTGAQSRGMRVLISAGSREIQLNVVVTRHELFAFEIATRTLVF